MGTFRPERQRVMATERDLVVLGAGMHPWGKWGKNFVDYGLVAAKAALADADVAWRDIEFVAGADTIRNGYPGFVAGSTFSQAMGWTGAQISSSYAACACGHGGWRRTDGSSINGETTLPPTTTPPKRFTYLLSMLSQLLPL